MSILEDFSRRRAQEDHEVSDWWKRLLDQQSLEADQDIWMKSLRDTLSVNPEENVSIVDVIKSNYFDPDTTGRKWQKKYDQEFNDLAWAIEYFSIDDLLDRKDKQEMATNGESYLDDWKESGDYFEREGGDQRFVYPLDLPVILSEIPNDLYLRMSNGLYLYDGVHRLSAHAYLNNQNVPAYVGRHQK